MKNYILLLVFSLNCCMYADVSKDTWNILFEFKELRDKLPLKADSPKYKQAKNLIKKAKKVYKASSDLDKLNLRYVRFSTNLMLACSCIRKNTFISKKAASFYLSVAAKDLGIGAFIFNKSKGKKHKLVWRKILTDYAIISKEYHWELYKSTKKVKNAVAKIKNLLSYPEKTKEREDNK